MNSGVRTMTTLKESPIKTKSKIKIPYKIPYIPDTAKEKPQRRETIFVGPLPLSTPHVN
jgi:hypothetical protein